LQCFQQTTDLPVLTFIESYFQPAMLIAVPQNSRRLGAQIFACPVFVVDRLNRLLSHSREQFYIRDAIYLHVIFFIQVTVWIRNPRCPQRIVRQHKQPFTRLIQPPNRANPRQVRMKQVIYGIASFFIGGSSDDAAGLIHHDVNCWSLIERRAIDLDLVHDARRGFWVPLHPSI